MTPSQGMYNRKRGFTLIELLVALAIFAVLSLIAYGSLDSVLKAKSRVEDQAQRLSELQMLFVVLGRDIEQAVNRPVRDEFGDPIAAMTSDGSTIEFTRAGWRNPAGLKRSRLQRVGYELHEDEILRRSWPTLDRMQGNEPYKSKALGAVSGFDLRFMNTDGQWLTQWPPLSSSAQQQQPPALPRAIEVAVDVEGWGRITRLFRIAAGMDRKAASS